ncbi:MAG: non-ribosomal peptide synthetase [Pseudomonadota bacterium]
MSTGTSYRAGRRILKNAEKLGDSIALVIDGERYRYSEMINAAQQLVAQFEAPAAEQPITAVMAGRHVSSYVGILAARLAGHAYVPLNVNHPPDRNARIMTLSGATTVICGEQAADALQGILSEAGLNDIRILRCGDSKRRLVVESVDSDVPVREQTLDDLAYILFTSGSTGMPKGVPIQNRALEGYLDAAGSLLDIGPEDRLSQTFELTFDLSVHDLFLAWENGATLVIASEADLRLPAAYIQRENITHWFSVPSLAYQIRLQDDLAPGAFPSVRSSLFCGEALPTIVAQEWVKAAPNSVVENWYGPTEATIACSRYVIDQRVIDTDTVPIGQAFKGMELLVLDDHLSPCDDGVPGELFLSGRQLAPGYLNDAEKTAQSFMTLPATGQAIYRTGDRAVRRSDGEVVFQGRVDNQVKVRGFRIELAEIEAALRSASDGLNAVALAWPPDTDIATSVVAAVETDGANTAAILDQVAGQLPEYMVPAVIHCIATFPKNASGKMDRKAIAAQLQSELATDEVDVSGLSDEHAFLLRAVLRFAPLLDRNDVLKAKNLFDAGMDSLAFISFTAEVEAEYDIALDQDTVILFSQMSVDDMVAEIRGETHRLARVVDDVETLSLWDRLRRALGLPRVIRKERANRALTFIERFPAYLQNHGAPDVLAVGSSGTFRAFCPADFAAAAGESGRVVQSINAGFPAVNAHGMTLMCDFIRKCCVDAGARVPIIVYEFDPMHICTVPPSGDIGLGRDYFDGNVVSLRNNRTSLEFQWREEADGAWNPPDTARQKDRKPNWVRKRDRVIAAAYLGDIEFEPKAVASWFAGARALQQVSDRMVCFVHPVDREMTDAIDADVGSDRLDDFLRHVEQELNIAVIDWRSFDLEPADFLDINHMNARGGREKLSRQLASHIF